MHLFNDWSYIPGPVFVEFPIDTLYPYPLVKKEIGMKDAGPQSLMQKIINWYGYRSADMIKTKNFEVNSKSKFCCSILSCLGKTFYLVYRVQVSFQPSC